MRKEIIRISNTISLLQGYMINLLRFSTLCATRDLSSQTRASVPAILSFCWDIFSCELCVNNGICV